MEDSYTYTIKSIDAAHNNAIFKYPNVDTSDDLQRGNNRNEVLVSYALLNRLNNASFKKIDQNTKHGEIDICGLSEKFFYTGDLDGHLLSSQQLKAILQNLRSRTE